MKKKYIVCTYSSSTINEINFKNRIEHLGLTWWHWIPGVWLIVDKIGNRNLNEIIKIALETLGNNYTIVVEATNNNNWLGYGVTESFNWLHDNWN